MKQRLLSFFATAALAMGALAQTWKAPVEPEAPISPATQLLADEAEVEAGESYYVMNVGCGQFLIGANSWATQISLSANATPYMKVIVNDISEGGDPNGKGNLAKGNGYTMQLDGSFQFTGDHDRTNYAVNDTYLFRDSEESGFIDLNNQKRGFVWKFTPTPNGHYYIQVISEDTAFPNAATQYAGGIAGEGLGGGKGVKFNCTKDDANIEWAFIPSWAYTEGDEDYEAKVNDYLAKVGPYNAAMKIYEARVTLYKALNDAVTYGADYSAASDVYNNAESTAAAIQTAATNLQAVIDARKPFAKLFEDAAFYGADATAAKAVYDNASATVEELNTAYEELMKLMPAAVIAYAAKNGTADAPCAMPYVIVNADFETPGSKHLEAPIGWSLTAGIGDNQGYQNNQDYKNEEAGIVIKNFIEAWRPAPNTLGNGQIYQEIAGLPAGHYILECDGIARNQVAYGNEGYVDPDDYTGIYLFYNDGAITVHSEESLKDIFVEEVDPETGDLVTKRLPTHFTFEFDIEEVESIKIGLMSENTNLNWMAADNFVLKYAGASQRVPSYAALLGELKVSADVMHDIEYSESGLTAEATIVKTFQGAYNDAQALYNAGYDAAKDAEYKAAFTALSNAREAYNVCHEAYNKVEAFIDKIDNDLTKYENKFGYGPLITALNTLLDKISKAYEGGVSADEINAAIDGYDAMIKEKVQAIFDAAVAAGEPLDEGIDITPLFEHMSFAYGTTQTAYANGYPAENPVWTNETKTGNFKTNYSTAEVWDARPFNISREFTNLPKGKYTIKTHAFYRVTANDTNYPNYMDGVYDEEADEYAYIYAGNNHKHLVNNAALATEEPAVSGNDYTTTDNTYIINGQQGAHLLFTDEKYEVQAEAAYIAVSSTVLEDNGTLRAGFAGTDLLEGNHWCVFDGFELYYEGVQEDLSEELQSLIASIEAIQNNNQSIKTVTKTNELLANALAAGKAALTQPLEQQKEAVKQMDEALKAYELTAKLEPEVKTLPHNYEEKMTAAGESTDTQVQQIVTEINSCMTAGKFESNEKLQGWIDTLPQAWFNYVLNLVALKDASETNPVEVPIIENPSFSTNNQNGWTVVQEGDQGGTSDGCSEFWNATSFDISQEFPYLKEGYWRLSVNALFRYGGADPDITALKNGTYKNGEYLYVNHIEKKVMDWHNTEGGAILATGEAGETAPFANAAKYTVTPTEGEAYSFWSTNSRAVFYNMITYVDPVTLVPAPRYLNTIDFSYGIENGLTDAVRIGLKKAEKFVDQEWCPFSNFKLEYLGTTPPTAVTSIDASTVAAPSAIFTIDGRRSAKLQRGINIVRNADGSVKKVLVK